MSGLAVSGLPSLRSWPATRDAALDRLQGFVGRAGDSYSRDRNYDLGIDRRGNVSGLSPYVRRRILSEAEIVRAVLEAHTLHESEKFVQEVFWRTYWKGWLHLRPEVWTDYRSDLAAAKGSLITDPDLAARYRNATDARTGIECFDSWAKELVSHGYLHNHTRMWFASVWIFTLRLPWVLGADFFYRHLLDADPASNTLSWRWVAGLHTRGKHYLARAENIRRFTEGRFDPAGQLKEEAEPLLDPRTYPASTTFAGASDGLGVSEALRTGLMLTVDDLWGDVDPSIQRLAALPSAVVAVLAPAEIEGGGRLARDFSCHAMNDATCRLEKDFSLSARRCLAPCDVTEWARSHDLEQVVVLDPGVGGTDDQLSEVAALLENDDIRLERVFRQWDRELFPSATAGFFKFKNQIPIFLRRNGML